MCPHDGIVDGQVADEVVLHPGWGGSEGVAHHTDEVELVDRARPADQVAEVGSGSGDIAGEQVGGVSGLPTPARGEPRRGW
jgi:hypothetical protein